MLEFFRYVKQCELRFRTNSSSIRESYHAASFSISGIFPLQMLGGEDCHLYRSRCAGKAQFPGLCERLARAGLDHFEVSLWNIRSDHASAAAVNDGVVAF